MKRIICLFVQVMLSCAVFAQTNYGPNKIFYQKSDPLLTIPSGAFTKIYHTDANGDGIQDIMVATVNQLYVLVFDAAGNYRSQTIAAGSHPVPATGASVAADFNGDGRFDVAWYSDNSRDIVISYWQSNDASGLPQYSAPARLNVTGFFLSSSAPQVYGMNAADLDGDGDADMIAFGDDQLMYPYMIINNGSGSFTTQKLSSEKRFMSFSQITDMNNDGKLDIIATYDGGIDIYTNTGNAGNPSVPVFTRTTLINSTDADEPETNSSWFDVVDFNNDGKKDILLTYTSYFEMWGMWMDKTRIFINTTSAMPGYSFQMTELIHEDLDMGMNSNGRIGGFGSRYEDVDGDGILDIIGSRYAASNYYVSDNQKIALTRLAIDASGNVSFTESVLQHYNPYLYGEMGAALIYEDIDGDNQRDYVYSSTYGNNGTYSHRTVFPVITGNQSSLDLSNTIFIGGDNNDDISLKITSQSGVRFHNYDYAVAAIDGDNTSEFTLTGKVADVNGALTAFNVNFPELADYTINFTVVNSTTGETYTNSMVVKLARIVYYPRPGSKDNVNDPASWSTEKDGSGSPMWGFDEGAELNFSNDAGDTSFAFNGWAPIGAKMVIPAGTQVALNGTIYLYGELDNKGTVTGSGELYMYGYVKEQILDGTITIDNFYVNNPYNVRLKGKLTTTNTIGAYSGKLIADGGVVEIKGGISYMQHIIDASAGEVIISGNAWQEYQTTAFAGPVGKLTIDCDERAVFTDGPLSVGYLNLVHGRLDTYWGTDITFNATNGGNASSFVSYYGGSNLKAMIANGQSVKFPVGYEKYNPVTITNNTGTDDEFTVFAADEYAGGYYDLFSMPHVSSIWNIYKANPNGGDGVDLTFAWDASQENELANAALYYQESGTWNKTTGTATVNGQSLTYTGYKGSFAPFTIIGSQTPLPVSWISFTATPKARKVVLDWVTGSEANTHDFVAEHSIDGVKWKAIGSVAARSLSTGSSYQFTHENPVTGKNYYRLNQRDRDGKNSYSKTATATIAGDNVSGAFKIYPNPVTNGVMNIILAQDALVSVYNNSGILIISKRMKAGSNQLEVGAIAKGIYSVRANNETIQVMIQ